MPLVETLLKQLHNRIYLQIVLRTFPFTAATVEKVQMGAQQLEVAARQLYHTVLSVTPIQIQVQVQVEIHAHHSYLISSYSNCKKVHIKVPLGVGGQLEVEGTDVGVQLPKHVTFPLFLPTQYSSPPKLSPRDTLEVKSRLGDI